MNELQEILVTVGDQQVFIRRQMFQIEALKQENAALKKELEELKKEKETV